MLTIPVTPSAPPMPFEQEKRVFDQNRAEWLRLGREGKFVVIKQEVVLGFYHDLPSAYAAGAKAYAQNFFVRKITREDEVQIINRVSW